MTPAQMKTFVRVAQAGWTCGLQHPYEWYVNAERMLDLLPYDQAEEVQNNFIDAFLAFFRGCSAGPFDPIENLTHDQLIDAIDAWYARPRENT